MTMDIYRCCDCCSDGDFEFQRPYAVGFHVCCQSVRLSVASDRVSTISRYLEVVSAGRVPDVHHLHSKLLVGSIQT